MNRRNLVRAIAEKTQTPQIKVNEFLGAFIDTVKFSVAEGERVKIGGFGTFESCHRGERVGRNPKTGEKVRVDAHLVPKFSPAECFREMLNSQ